MNRRKFVALTIATSLFLTLPILESRAAGETAALLKLLKSTQDNDPATIGPVAEKARKIGWQIPTTGAQVKLLGPWKFTTWKGEKGAVTFLKGGGLSFDGDAHLPFTSWEVQTSKGKPALLVLKGTGKNSVFQYFQRPGVATISNLAKRSQWLVMTANN